MTGDRMLEPGPDDKACQISVNWNGEAPWCWVPAAAACTIWCACGLHSHDRLTCQEHVTPLMAGVWDCGPCEEGGTGCGGCVLRVDVKWLREASSRG